MHVSQAENQRYWRRGCFILARKREDAAQREMVRWTESGMIPGSLSYTSHQMFVKLEVDGFFCLGRTVFN